MKNTKFVKNQRGNLLVEAMLGIALAGAGFLIYYEIEHHIAEKKQFSKVTSDMYQQYNVFLTALDKYAQSNNSTQVVSCQQLKNGYLAQDFNCTDYLGDTLEGILIKNQTQTPTAYVVGVPSTSSQSMLHSYNVSSVQVLNQSLAQSQPQNTPHEFFVVNVNNYIGYPVINISQSMSFSSIASYLPQQGLKLGNNSYVISLVDASTLNPSAAPPSCNSSSSILSPPGTWDHSFTNVTSYQTCSGTVCTNVSITSITQCSYTEWQPYQYCSYVNGQTSTSNNGSPFSTSSCWLVNSTTNTSSSNVYNVFTGTSSCPSGYTGSISNYDSVTSYTNCTNGNCSTWSTSNPAPSVSNCSANPPPQTPQPSQQPQQPTGSGGGGGNGSGTTTPGSSVCPPGYVWNSYQQACVNETQYTMACYPPYYNAVPTNGPYGQVLCAYWTGCPNGSILVTEPYDWCATSDNAQYTCPPGYTFDSSNLGCVIPNSWTPCPDLGIYENAETIQGWSCSINEWCAINCFDSSGNVTYSQGYYAPANATARNGYYLISTSATLVSSLSPVNASGSCPDGGIRTAPDIPVCFDYGYFTSTATPLSCPAGTALNVNTGTCQ